MLNASGTAILLYAAPCHDPIRHVKIGIQHLPILVLDSASNSTGGIIGLHRIWNVGLHFDASSIPMGDVVSVSTISTTRLIFSARYNIHDCVFPRLVFLLPANAIFHIQHPILTEHR